MSLLADARHTIRHLRQAPGFTIATVLTFAVAIGSNSAIFSAVNTVLLRPLPVTAPEHPAVIWQTDRGGQAVIELTHRHLREWMESSSTFTHASLIGSHNRNAVLEGRGEPTRVWFSGVSGTIFDNPTLNHQVAGTGYFEAMKIPLRAGRFFTDRHTSEAPRVAIVDQSTAQRLWPGQNAIGKRIWMASFTPGVLPMWRTVVGVASDVRYRGLQGGAARRL